MPQKQTGHARILLTWAALLLCAAPALAVVHVSPTGSNADGNAWVSAYTDLQTAVNDAAVSGEPVWVAAGTFLLAAPLVLDANTEVYGGFPPTGDPGMADRNPAAYATVLDGQNAVAHVIVADGAQGVRLDGLTVQGGKAAGTAPDNNGGGILMRQSSSGLIVDCVVRDNQAQAQGGGIFCENSQLTITDSTVQGNAASEGGGVFAHTATVSLKASVLLQNTAQQQGGGLGAYASSVSFGQGCLVRENSSSYFGGGLESRYGTLLALRDTEVSGNTAAQEGGGIKLHSMQQATVDDCLIHGNTADALGGGISCYSSPLAVTGCVIAGNQGGRGGGIECHESSAAQLVNCIITGNSATTSGGGISLDFETAVVSYCTVADNVAGDQGGGLHALRSSVTASECVFWGNGPDQINGMVTATYCDVEGGAEGAGNIDADPLFVNAAAGDYHLRFGSPCIDAAPSADWPVLGLAGSGTDFEGDPRATDYPGLGVLAADSNNDIGADEALPGPPVAPVQPGAAGIAPDGLTWTWQDDALNETGFKVWADAGGDAPSTLRAATEAGAAAWTMTGLTANTLYTFQVAATNLYGDSAKTAPYGAWTLAQVPGAPVVSDPTLNSLRVAVAPDDGNPQGTEYAVKCVGPDQWVQADGTLGDTPVFQTASGWGTTVVSGLAPGTAFLFSVCARNNAGIVTSAGPGAGASTHVLVPGVAGLGRVAAETAITEAGLTLGTVTEAHDAAVPAGSVISQTPAAGTEAAPGDTVNLSVSLGPMPVSVPLVLGLALADAQTAITAAGLSLGPLAYTHSDVVAAGLVMVQAPDAGTEVVPGAPVSLQISLGPAPVTVPNVVGLGRAQAVSVITGAGLTIGAVTEANSAAVAAGNVLSQDPAADAEVSPGTAVNFVVSLGPAPTEGEPSPVDAEQARQTLADGFDAADTDGDGRLGYDEAAAAMDGLTREVFDALDTNQDGLLSADELEAQPQGCAGLQCGKTGSHGPVTGKMAGDALTVLLSLVGLAVMAGLSRP